MMFLSIKESNYELALLEKRYPAMTSRFRCLKFLKSYPLSDLGRLCTLHGIESDEIERIIILYRIGGIKLLLDSRTKALLSKGRNFSYFDIRDLLTRDELANSGAIMELLNYSQASRTPDRVKVNISEQQILNGNHLKYPNGKESDDTYYGFGRGVNYIVLNRNGLNWE
jgi:hypothetical protein